LDILGGIWHLLNFFAPALGVGLFATLLAKVFWYRELLDRAWWRLWAWSSGLACVVSIGGLVFFGRDGKMATYGAMLLACSLGLWWAGFIAKRR
jgi:hypothetical protein